MIEHHLSWTTLENAMYRTDFPQADAIFSHGWGDLNDETIALIAKAYGEVQPKFIVLNGLEEYQGGKPGFSYWKRQLVEKHNVPSEIIFAAAPGPQTLNEATGFADFAQTHSITSAILVSVPMHIMRAFLTNLGVAKQRNLPITFYPRTTHNINWEEQVVILGLVGVHADEETNRLGRLVGECARIMNYRQEYENGNTNFIIASIREGLEHLKITPVE